MNFEHAIVAQNLGYQIEQQNVLTDLNFTIKKNEKVAIIGQSGSGKSTLLKILSGQLPDYSGSLNIDGREVKELTRGQLRQITQYVDQNNYLFNDSIVNNITIWAENPAVEKVLICTNYGGCAILSVIMILLSWRMVVISLVGNNKESGLPVVSTHLNQ